VPSDWLHAIIVPVFKKGSARIAANCRPISLTCVPSKVMKCIWTVLEHLVENDLLSSAQHEFLKGKSTSTNLLSLQNKYGITVAYTDLKNN